MNLSPYGIHVKDVVRNAPTAVLYEDSVGFDGAAITASGAINVSSGERTGRSPKDKRIVEHPDSREVVWWGPVNKPIRAESFRVNHQRAIDYLNTYQRLYVLDGFAGWHPRHHVKVRLICSRPYHALFMHNMLIRPSADELRRFGKPDYVIYNAGCFPADAETPDLTSNVSVNLNFESGEIVILGTQYAGEMKKGVFTIMHYLMPKRGVLSMHCSANEGDDGDVSLFFGLSGTGKTTLSADPRRKLIGDDEHCWSDEGVFNIEGGCYAKCIDLSEEKEPEIYRAIRFGTILENTVQDSTTRKVDFADGSVTQNTRASYPIEYIANAKVPCVGEHPRNIVFLTCDAFGVLPPVARLTPQQAMYHFISGYTAKVAGTEMGVVEPQATFSACYGAAFLVWHPMKYARLLAEKMEAHGVEAWLVNTGWTGGSYGHGHRMDLKHTRAIIDAIHDGSLAKSRTKTDPVFGFELPTNCSGAPSEILIPRNTWYEKREYDEAARKLAHLFHDNFEDYVDEIDEDVCAAGPQLAAEPVSL